ncbi:YfiR family protein [Inhella gelatinilytica]|uniref:YfiR family protein n=1 Tax=Inhella gelatinilytica TaxID=2795030 RepID=A0A931IW51_9BURK|nr:YfiR family protein [Inhella gelatinilytica]MBH9552105.1 YfiR family protein [Inhella gelatinilytica]
MRRLIPLLLALWTGPWALAHAQAQATAAPQLKAQVLLKILKFVEWPPAALGDLQALQICLTDDSALAQHVSPFAGQTLNQHALKIRSATRHQLLGCHVVLVSGEPGWSAPSGALVVTDTPGLMDHGAMLNLHTEEGRVVFDIELDATRRAGLDVSARLLRLTRFVKKSG